MQDETSRAEINMARIPVRADFGGLLFAIGTVIIFYFGIPALQYTFPAAILAGCGVALLLRFVHHEN